MDEFHKKNMKNKNRFIQNVMEIKQKNKKIINTM